MHAEIRVFAVSTRITTALLPLEVRWGVMEEM